MVAKLVGYDRNEWTDKNTGKDRRCIVLHLVRQPYPGAESRIEGLVTETRKFFDGACDILPNPLVVGTQYRILTEKINGYDYCVEFSKIDDSGDKK